MYTKEIKAESEQRDIVTCYSVGGGTNGSQIYWIEGKVYEVVRRTKASFWVLDELGFERRFSSKTGGSTTEKEDYKTFMF